MTEPRAPDPEGGRDGADEAPRAESVFDRSLILASAGSGKTFRLSSRLIGLLAAGVPPESILASTFTRKAAGEILDRVLLRLARAALDGVLPEHAGAATELARSLPDGVPRDEATSDAFRALLARTVGDLHRLQVHTLDAFLHQAARAFPFELGLPPGWTIGTDPANARLRARAVDEVLDADDDELVRELTRLVFMGEAERAVHENLHALLDDAHRLHRERDPSVASLWGFEDGGGGWPSLPAGPDERWREHADRVVAVREGLRADESLSDRLDAAIGKLEQALRLRDAAGLAGQTLWRNAVEQDSPTYYRKPIPEELVDLLSDVASEIPALVGPAWQRRVEAIGRFIPRYDARLEALRRAEGVFGFDDMTHRIAGAGALGRADELYYRLDGRIRHILLDEFQDTSSSQWAALAPLVDELLSGDEDRRALLIVADPKQSIYGWRGGEPRILDQIRERYGLGEIGLHESHRSSPVVLDFVNRIFGPELPDNPAVRERAPAEAWMSGFRPHAAHERRSGLPGHVLVVAGPAEPEGYRGGIRTALIAAAADRIRALHAAAPGRSIGVLTRKNVVATRIMAELRDRGVDVSEEGGVPVADSAPVLAILALLAAADHPADRTSAYLAAHSPLGAAEGLAGPEYRDPTVVERVGRRIRARLIARGYGAVVAEWARRLRSVSSPRDLRRLDQLVELASGWDEAATLRPSDFVAMARAARREDAAAAPVRVMTVHRAKGLEFDIVVLPELHASRGGGRGSAVVPFREVPGGPVTRVYPALPEGLTRYFPEMGPALDQQVEARVRDELSTLYVALTRARNELVVLLPPDGAGPSTARDSARLVRGALAANDRLEPDELLFEAGEPAWHERMEDRGPGGSAARPSAARTADDAGAAPIHLAAPTGRRLLPRRTPSELEGGSTPSLAHLLRPAPADALARGTLAHRLLEGIPWMEDGLSAARELAARFPFRLDAPEVREVLERSAWPEGTTVRTELPFVVRDGGALLHGVADRVLRIPDREGWTGPLLVVVDWKTDRIEDDGALGTRTAWYRPQMEAYLRALSRVERIPPARVEGRIVFLEAGRAVRVTSVPGGGDSDGTGAVSDPRR